MRRHLPDRRVRTGRRELIAVKRRLQFGVWACAAGVCGVAAVAAASLLARGSRHSPGVDWSTQDPADVQAAGEAFAEATPEWKAALGGMRDAGRLSVFSRAAVLDGRLRGTIHPEEPFSPAELTWFEQRLSTYRPRAAGTPDSKQAVQQSLEALGALEMFTRAWVMHGPMEEDREAWAAQATRMRTDPDVLVREAAANLLWVVSHVPEPHSLSAEAQAALDEMRRDPWIRDRWTRRLNMLAADAASAGRPFPEVTGDISPS